MKILINWPLAPTNKLHTRAFHLSGFALLASDYLVGLSGNCMADGWHHDATGKAVRALIHRVSSALYDAKYPAENLGHLGAAAVYSVQHGNGVYLAAAACYEP